MGSEHRLIWPQSDPALKIRFTTLQQLIDQAVGFDQTAAVLLNTDLLITNDTAIAHLAGALGHPTWLLLKWSPDWRWGLDGRDSAWYPSIRLFSQPSEGNWQSVVQQISASLKKI